MENLINLISLDSMEGVGVTTQVKSLNQQLKKIGYNVEIINYISPEQIEAQIPEITELINKPNTIVLYNGFFTRSLAYDITNGLQYSQLFEKYNKVIQYITHLRNIYNVVNISLIPPNTNMGIKFLQEKYAQIGSSYENNISEDIRKSVLDIFGNLNTHVITGQISFKYIAIKQYDKILDVNYKIWAVLEEWGLNNPHKKNIIK